MTERDIGLLIVMAFSVVLLAAMVFAIWKAKLALRPPKQIRHNGWPSVMWRRQTGERDEPTIRDRDG